MADDKSITNAEVVTNEEGRTEPVKGKRVRLSNATTPDGAPVFGEIIIDPDTGDLLEYDLSDEAKQQMQEAANKAIKAATGDSLPQLQEAIKKAVRNAAAFQLSDALQGNFEQLQEAVLSLTNNFLTEETRQTLQRIADDLKPIQDILNEIEELRPYIDAELSKPEYKGIVLEELLNDYTPAQLLELPADSMLSVVLEAARAARAADEPALTLQPYRATSMQKSIDKLNLFAWGLPKLDGQVSFELANSTDENNGLSVPGFYALSFPADDDETIKLPKTVNYFDERVQAAAASMFIEGRDIQTTTDIYYGMGNKGKPSKYTLDKINNSLTKQGMARAYINNKYEAERYNYPLINQDENLIMFTRVNVVINGRETVAIQLAKEPFLMRYARAHKQVSAVPIAALQSGVSQTEAHLEVEAYLLRRIAQQKRIISDLRVKQQKKYLKDRQQEINKARDFSIMLDTFYTRTRNDRKDDTGKRRARETAAAYLTHYKSEAGGNWIEDFEIKKDRIEIKLP